MVWATAGRERLLDVRVDAWVATALKTKAREVSARVIAVGCADDHVHVLARLPSTTTLAALAQRLKGATSHALNAGRLLSQPFAWQEGYWAESVSPSQALEVARYVQSQRPRHASLAPVESWERTFPSPLT